MSEASDFSEQVAQAVQQGMAAMERHHEIRQTAKVLGGLMSGSATFDALISAVQELSRLAPDDCDVFVRVDNVSVLKVRFIEPHSFSFEGINQDGHRTWIVIHFSQLHASVVYLPKRQKDRIITGFSRDRTP